MTIAEQFPFEFDGADVTLNRLGTTTRLTDRCMCMLSNPMKLMDN